MFGLLICLAAGIRPIITSSSDQKLDLALSAGKPGSIDTINYRTHPQWEEEVHRLTNGRGVDVVIESVGITTMAQSLASLARRGTVSVVGFLGGFDVDRYPDTILPVLLKSATIRYVHYLFLWIGVNVNDCVGVLPLDRRRISRICVTF